MYSIIIIDNDRKAIEDLIEGTDWKALKCYVVETAEDGRMGMEAIKEFEPDLVLLDSRTSGMGWLDIVNSLKGQGFRGHFIMMTEHRDFEEARLAIQSGVRGLLLKPLNTKELERPSAGS